MATDKLTWPDPSPPTEGVSHYDHIRAHGFTIEWKSWKDYPGYTLVRDVIDTGFIGTFDTLDEAKAAAEALQPDALRRRVETLEAFANEVISRCESMGMPGHQLATLARAALAAAQQEPVTDSSGCVFRDLDVDPPAAQQEPARRLARPRAYIVHDDENGDYLTWSAEADMGHGHTPLYAGPLAAAQQEPET